MGTSKAGLAWDGSTLVARTCVELLHVLDGPVVVVGSPAQVLPPLPAPVAVHHDPEAGLGPVQGLAVGLGALADRVDVAFVCSTDLPFLDRSFVRCVIRTLEARPESDVVVPVVDGRAHPLAAAYRTSLAASAQSSTASGQLRLLTFLAAGRVFHLSAEELLRDPEVAASDPRLASVTNVNDPQDYARALRASTG